jgi:hypothetical protein
MSVIIFETCRSPEIKKLTEAVVLSRFFTEKGIDYELYSNDHIWPDPVTLNKVFIQDRLGRSEAKIVHLAMHGDHYSLILNWSKAGNIASRVPEDQLTGPEIRQMAEWQEKLIVSGACSSARLAPFFLAAGAAAVVAPEFPINWPNLGAFFCTFYEALFSGPEIAEVLALACSKFPEYRSYRLYQKKSYP